MKSSAAHINTSHSATLSKCLRIRPFLLGSQVKKSGFLTDGSGLATSLVFIQLIFLACACVMKESKISVWNKAHPDTPRTEIARGLLQPHPIIPSLILFRSFPRLSSIYFASLYSEGPILETCASSFYFGKQKYNTDISDSNE